MLGPQYFIPYPIDTNKTQIYNSSKYTNSYPQNQTISFNMDNSQTVSAASVTYIKKITSLNTYWRRLVITRQGRDADINIKRVFLLLQNNMTSGSTKRCENIMMTYPPANYTSIKNDCNMLNVLDSSMALMWSQATSNRSSQVFQLLNDSFNPTGPKVLTVVQAFYDWNVSASQPIGIIGVQYDIGVLNKLISQVTPLILTILVD